MAYNVERCFHRAMMKHFPGEDGDTDDEFWIREDGKREKRSRRTIRSNTGNPWTRSRDSEGPGKRQPHVQNGGKLPPHKAKHRVPTSSSSSFSVENPSHSSVNPTVQVASSNGRGVLRSHHYGGIPSHVSHPEQIVSTVLLPEKILFDRNGQEFGRNNIKLICFSFSPLSVMFFILFLSSSRS